MAITKKEALAAIDREREPICAASDAVWEHPETAFQEFASTEILCDLPEHSVMGNRLWEFWANLMRCPV